MDKIKKALRKLPNKQRQKLMNAFERVMQDDTQGLKIKKMRGHKNLYRLRIGDSRLVFRQESGKKPKVVFVGKRDDQTYRDF